MTSKAQDICEAVSPVLSFARWTGVLPIIPYIKSGKQNISQCCFKVSRFWTVISIIIQLFFLPFVVILLIDLFMGFSNEEVLWNAMKVMYLIHHVEMYAILILGVSQAKQIAKLLEQMAQFPSLPEDTKWIGRFMKIILAVLLSFFSMYSATHFLSIWIERNKIKVFTVQNFTRTSVGILVHSYLALFTQVQCLIAVLFCLLISSKFKYLTNLIAVTFNKTSNPFVTDNHKAIIIKPSANVSTVSKSSSFKIDTEYLENLHLKFCDLNDCLDKINQRIGFQLLLSISVILYTLIFFIFCEISVEGYNDDAILVFTSIFGTCVLIIRLTLYMWIGLKVKNQSMEPVKTLQQTRVLQYSQEIQQQIQMILLQWCPSDPSYLSAFCVMNVGPWLLTSIIGNVITYLLVFIQISKSQTNSNK